MVTEEKVETVSCEENESNGAAASMQLCQSAITAFYTGGSRAEVGPLWLNTLPFSRSSGRQPGTYGFHNGAWKPNGDTLTWPESLSSGREKFIQLVCQAARKSNRREW